MKNISVMISEEELAQKIEELGKRITEDYKGKSLLFLVVLNGSFVFSADLVRKIALEDIEIRFIRAKSYCGTETTGKVQMNKTEDMCFTGKNVLIVEDIIDSGFTLKMLKESINLEKPESVKIATLLDKPSRRVVKLEPDYSCFEIPDKFVVGYGLDFDEKYRQLPYVGEITPE